MKYENYSISNQIILLSFSAHNLFLQGEQSKSSIGQTNIV